MSVLDWFAAGSRRTLTILKARREAARVPRRGSAPVVEALERIDLMTRAGYHLPIAMAATTIANHSAIAIDAAPAVSATQTTAVQTATVPSTLTNFSQSFTPALNLFNPALGTLTAVHISTTASLTSQIVSENTSTSSPATITATSNGTYQIAGLGSQTVSGTLMGQSPSITVPAFAGGPIDFTGPSTAKFAPLTESSTQSVNYTAASDLAFFTAVAGHTTITPVLTANATAGASAPNGNLQTMVSTSGSGVVTITYDYIPAPTSLVSLIRYGIHHQPTQLQLTFSGTIVPSEVTNPANYYVVAPNRYGSFIGAGTTTIPIVSAVYDPTGNTVTLTTAKRLNYHKLFQLHVNLPSNNGAQIIIEFGGPQSLGGFRDPRTGAFVPVTNGYIPPRYRV